MGDTPYVTATVTALGDVTDPPSVTDPRCEGCGAALPRAGRRDRRYCSGTCRQRARRARVAAAPATRAAAARTPRIATVYECPACRERMLGEQRCPECNVFCRRIGPGGECPCCGEPVAIADLIQS